VCPRSGAAPVAEAVAVIELLDERIAALDRELGPLARADRRVSLLGTIPGIGPLLGLTIAAEIGDVARFQSPPKLTGYSGLAPRVKQSGQRSRSGELSKAGSRTLRFAAAEAAQGAWRETNLGTASTRTQGADRQGEPGQVGGRPQGSHRPPARAQPRTALQAAPPQTDLVPASSPCFLAADGPHPN
jgi:hypothetical protein